MDADRGRGWWVAALVVVLGGCGPVEDDEIPEAPGPVLEQRELDDFGLDPSEDLPPVVRSAASGLLGSHLVDQRDRPLYRFEADSAGASTCHDRCAQVWLPFFATGGDPRAELPAREDLLGTVSRRDGSLQVTYAGWAALLLHARRRALDHRPRSPGLRRRVAPRDPRGDAAAGPLRRCPRPPPHDPSAEVGHLPGRPT